MSSRRSEYFAWILVGSVALVGIVVFLFGYETTRNLAPDVAPSLSAEAAKVGLQVAFAGVGGAIVAALLRYVDAIREERRRVREYLLQTLTEAVAAYNGVKAARRRLRAIGLEHVAEGAMTEEQEKAFVAEMDSLSDIQLSLEAIKRRTKARADVFGPVLFDDVDELERYVGRVLKYWEQRHAPDHERAGRAEVLKSWRSVGLFVARSSRSNDFRSASEPMNRIEQLIAARVLRV
jgi:hypothetical protein